MPKNLNLTDNLEQYIINHSDDLTETQKEIIKYNKSLGDQKKLQISISQAQFLQSLIKDDESVSCVDKTIDRYKRIVAVCYYLNEDLGKLMVKNGWAIAYRKYSKDYIAEENYAKENKLGIWQGKFIEPYKWRKKNK